MGCCTLSCSSTKRPRGLGSTIQKKALAIGKKKGVVEAHDEVKLPKDEVEPAD